MKIQVLMENTACSEQLTAEHGLSLYIETQGQTILFDAGATEAFAENAEKMGVDLQKVDFAVLSHGHDDHSGGLKHFLELNDHAMIYASRHASQPLCYADERYIGVDLDLLSHPRMRWTDDECVINENCTLLSCNQLPRPYYMDSFGLQMKKDNAFVPDVFQHEQYLLIQEQGRRILISGCSHKGILNIMGWLKPDVLIGGFHFMKMDVADEKTRSELEDAARKLLAYPTMYYTGHCTGLEQYAFLKEIMGERLQYLPAGKNFEV